MHSWKLTNQPSLKRDHVDGPLVTFRDGTLHWLTLVERVALLFGRTDAHRLEAKHRPDLAAYGRI